MRILHTADWHLCHRQGRVSRTQDLQQRLDQVATICEERKVDVLLVAGDLFFENASHDDVTSSLNQLHKSFKSYFARGGLILAITGNHDRDRFTNVIQGGMKLAIPKSGDGVLQPGRMYLQSGRGVATFQTGGETVQFVYLPFPNAHQYLESSDNPKSKEEQNRAILSRVTSYLRELVPKGAIQPDQPSILLAHLTLEGIRTRSGHTLNETDGVTLQDVGIFDGFSYVALGDVHKAMKYKDNPRVQYSGSLDRLDFGEKDNNCGVIFLEVKNKRLTADPEFIPIPPTPLIELVMDDYERQLPEWQAKYTRDEQSIFKIKVNTKGLEKPRDVVQRDLHSFLKRVLEIIFFDPDQPPPTVRREVNSKKDLAQTVKEYLQNKLENDPDKEALLALADQFLQQGVSV